MSRRERIASGPTPRLYQRAFDILARQISEGTIPAGSRLQESGVAQQFGISRAPARRALAELERGGLLEKPAGRGYLVRRIPSQRARAASGAAPPEGSSRLLSLPTWERIYGEVENEIIARIAFASWRMNEAELARFYGVSRTVTRDVIGRLQQRGLLRKDDSARWYAPALTPDHVGELYELRWVLEPVALTKAAPQVPPAFLAGLRVHLEDAIANAHAIGGSTLDSLEEEMHVALLGHCGNKTLMQAIALQQSLLIAHRFLYRWTPRLFDTEPFLPEHREIIERLEQGKTKAAAKSLERHLRVSRDRAISRIDAIRREMTPEELPYLERLSSA
ncbi:MAG: GntR family transcriptional regulator [Kiloniellaceae bacterium]|nr:GntR family transcriptional regulator [Kiloniellaceae bacterium]